MKLYGIAEIAAELGERRQTVAQWYQRGKLPEPAGRLAMGPVWTDREIGEWLRERKTGGAKDGDSAVQTR